MQDPRKECLICQGAVGDTELQRIQVWEDALWRLTISLNAEIGGFAYLEPKRHIEDIAALDGEEAQTLGKTLSRVSQALCEATGAERVYVYVFGGGIPHLHIHLAPHHPGDALNTQMIRGDFIEEKLESGATRYTSKDFPVLPESEQQSIARQVQAQLMSQ